MDTNAKSFWGGGQGIPPSTVNGTEDCMAGTTSSFAGTWIHLNWRNGTGSGQSPERNPSSRLWSHHGTLDPNHNILLTKKKSPTLQKSNTFCHMDSHTYRLIGKVTAIFNCRGRWWCLKKMEVSWIINFYVHINKYSGPEQACGVSYSWEWQDCTVMNMPKSRHCGCWQEQTLWLPGSKISTQSVTQPMTRQGLPACPIFDVRDRRGM